MRILEFTKTEDYLVASEYIDHQHADIIHLAAQLANEVNDADMEPQFAIAKRCFEFVRDEIKHTGDFEIDVITCKSSDVLYHKTGYCYAKSHLLAALLRANKIPAGLCYQRTVITTDENYASSSGEPYCLHGLNAIYLPKIGWYRVDARGNKTGVNAEFCPPYECLAFSLEDASEVDFETIYLEPLPEVVDTLTSYFTCRDVSLNLPDKIA